MAILAVMQPPIHDGTATDRLDGDIVQQLDERSVLGLDELIVLLPHYSWSQIFSAVDRLARRGTIVLRRHRFSYTLFSKRVAS
jgi:hypothetical protein